MEIKTIKLEYPEEANIILGQSHFIKTAEDLYEIMVSTVPGMKFGIAFNEASGPCLVRAEGNDNKLKS
ncbi:MAG: adenosine-specific kinase, partial [Candidatus Caldatribacteriota bacterium]